jgi:hypothetical protein
LGAGATRGASFVDGSTVLRPPLDTDFFAQLRGSDVGQDSDAQELLKFIADEFGDFSLSMEAFYSQVHLHEQFVADLPKGKGRRRSYEWAGKRFLRILPELFGAALEGQRCSRHDALVGALDANDVIVSFNYDCLVDCSLRDVGKRKWDPAKGYGVAATGGVHAWQDHSGRGRFPIQGLRVLKLHGSLNWRVSGDRLELLDVPYVRRPDGELVLVPPLWQKSFDYHPFNALWRTARAALTSTKALLFIGYSLPLTDVYTQAMLRIDVTELDFILIANPDTDARARIRRVLRSALRPATRIVEVDTLDDVGRLLV